MMYENKTAGCTDSDVQSTSELNKKTKLSFIIVNYNLAAEIEDCLNSMLVKIDPAGPVEYEVIIVDNNSPDKALPSTEKKFPQKNFHFFYLNENGGFGKGCNYGFSKATGEFICFLNPDTLIKEDILPAVMDLFRKDNSVGIIGPKQMVRGSLFDFSAGFYPNLLFEIFNLFGAGVFFEGFIVNLYQKFAGKDYLKVDWILGAAIFMRAELFRQSGGFSKDYFMFFEEVDLCKRVSDLGYKIIYYPKINIHHIGSVSGKKDYRLYAIRTYSSKYIYLSKYYKGLTGIMMKALLFVQLFSQMLIWTILFPRNPQKSKQKLSAFSYLIRNRLRMR